jgi:hypothetical protein
MKRLPVIRAGAVAPPTVRAGAAGLCLGLCLTLGIVHARADVRYTTETQMGSPADAAPSPDKKEDSAAAKLPTLRTTTYVRGMQQRVETVMDMGAMKSSTVSLTLCDTRRIITMDPDLKLYTVASMDGGSAGGDAAPQTEKPAPGGASDKKPESDKKPDTGHVISTYNIQDLGTEKVNDINAHHYMVTLRVQRSGCAGKGDSTMKMETWVAPGELGGLDCEERVPTAAPRTVPNEKGCRITFETKGDTGLLGNVFRGIVVRQRMYNGDKVAMTQEVRDIASAPLNATLFAPPADFRQVTAAEYTEAKRKAMMTALSAPAAPAAAGDGGKGGKDGKDGTVTAPPPAPGTGTTEPAPAPKRRRGGFGGLGGALGGVLGGRLPGAGSIGRLGGLGGSVLSALGGERGLGGIANALASGMLGGAGGYSPLALPGNAGEALSLLGSLPDR